MSRTKGHSFERSIARDFQSLGFTEARRHLEYQDGEANGIDLINTGGFAVQCKRGRKYASFTKIDEIQQTGKVPLLITKADHKPTMVALPWEHFMVFMKLFNDAK